MKLKKIKSTKTKTNQKQKQKTNINININSNNKKANKSSNGKSSNKIPSNPQPTIIQMYTQPPNTQSLLTPNNYGVGENRQVLGGQSRIDVKQDNQRHEYIANEYENNRIENIVKLREFQLKNTSNKENRIFNTINERMQNKINIIPESNEVSQIPDDDRSFSTPLEFDRINEENKIFNTINEKEKERNNMTNEDNKTSKKTFSSNIINNSIGNKNNFDNDKSKEIESNYLDNSNNKKIKPSKEQPDINRAQKKIKRAKTEDQKLLDDAIKERTKKYIEIEKLNKLKDKDELQLIRKNRKDKKISDNENNLIIKSERVIDKNNMKKENDEMKLQDKESKAIEKQQKALNNSKSKKQSKTPKPRKN
jgi:hypothetical protein